MKSSMTVYFSVYFSLNIFALPLNPNFMHRIFGSTTFDQLWESVSENRPFHWLEPEGFRISTKLTFESSLSWTSLIIFKTLFRIQIFRDATSHMSKQLRPSLPRPLVQGVDTWVRTKVTSTFVLKILQPLQKRPPNSTAIRNCPLPMWLCILKIKNLVL